MAIKRITTNLIKDSDIATVDIANNAITAAKITDGNITTAKLADLSVTAGKLAGTLDLTGKTITVATATTGDNDTSPASTAFVQQEIAALVDSSPDSLNTLNELAAALGDDASFSTTVTNSIATKLPLAGGTLTGNLGVGITASSAIGIYHSQSLANGLAAELSNTQSSTGSGLVVKGGNNSSTYSADFRNYNNSSLMRIRGDGNVGIGTTNPDAPLHITSNTPIISFDESDASQEYRIGSFGGTFALYDSTDSAYRLAVDGSGNVGIGTTSPQAPLHARNGSSGVSSYTAGTRAIIEGTATTYLTLASPTTSNKGILFADSDDSDAGFITYDPTDNLDFGTAGSTRLRIDSSGNVGIGTTSPTTHLSVANSGFTNSSTTGIPAIRAEGSYGGAIGLLDTKEAGWYAQDNGDTLYQYVGRTSGTAANASIVMTYKSSGNVGIGTSSPTAKLDVRGSVNSEHAVFTGGTNSTRGLSIQTTASGGQQDCGVIFDAQDTESGQNPFIQIKAAGNDVAKFSKGSTDKYSTSIGGLGGNGANLVLDGDDSEIKMANNIIHSDNSGTTKLTIRTCYANTSASAQLSLDGGFISFKTGTSFDEKMRLQNNTLYVSTDIGAHSNVTSFAHSTYAHAAVFGANSTPDGTVVIEDYDVSSGIGNTVLKLYLRDQDPATHAVFIDFSDGGGRVGSVTHNDDGGGVTYNTTSDYRLKENVEYNWDATTLLKQLKPAKFNFIGKTDKTRQGFLAHEVMDIVPGSVRGTKDQMEPVGTITDNDGNVVNEGVYEHFCKEDQTWTQTGTEPYYQQLDYARLVPLLTKAIQEQQTIIDDLKSRLDEAGL